MKRRNIDEIPYIEFKYRVFRITSMDRHAYNMTSTLNREWLFDVSACVVRRWRGSCVNGRGWMEVGPRSYLHRRNGLGS